MTLTLSSVCPRRDNSASIPTKKPSSPPAALPVIRLRTPPVPRLRRYQKTITKYARSSLVFAQARSGDRCITSGWAASSCQCCHEPGTRRSWLFSARATSSGGLPGRTVTPYVHFIRAQLQQGLVIEKPQMIEMLYKEPTLAERFLTHMLTRNIRIEEDLIDQLFNSSEKRLARATARKTSRCGCRSSRRRHSPRWWAPRDRASAFS
jgi:hypothetical protein